MKQTNKCNNQTCTRQQLQSHSLASEVHNTHNRIYRQHQRWINYINFPRQIQNSIAREISSTQCAKSLKLLLQVTISLWPHVRQTSPQTFAIFSYIWTLHTCYGSPALEPNLHCNSCRSAPWSTFHILAGLDLQCSLCQKIARARNKLYYQGTSQKFGICQSIVLSKPQSKIQPLCRFLETGLNRCW